MCTDGGSSFPRVITPFEQGRRGSRAPSQSLVPRSGVSFLIPESRSSFRSLVPRSGVSFLVPDLTYTFITPSPPSEKEALLTPGNSLTVTSIVGVAQKPRILTTMRRGPSVVCLVRASFLSCVLFLLVTPKKFFKGEVGR